MGEVWFWIFAVIQAFCLFALFKFGLIIALRASGSYPPTFVEPSIPLLFVISTIGIEYLIFSKK